MQLAAHAMPGRLGSGLRQKALDGDHYLHFSRILCKYLIAVFVLYTYFLLIKMSSYCTGERVFAHLITPDQG